MGSSGIGSGRVRVLVVDDSAFMRKIISNILEEDPEIEVIGTARDGKDALDKVAELNPDVVTLDVEMPRMDGLEFLKTQMAIKPVKVLMISSLTQEGASVTLEALESGAIDFVAKPSGSLSLDMHKVADEMRKKVKNVSKAFVRIRQLPQRKIDFLHTTSTTSTTKEEKAKLFIPSLTEQKEEKQKRPLEVADRLVIIGSSTGGPSALMEVIPNLPDDLDVGYVVIQHMPPGFTKSLADRLDRSSKVMVKEAEPGDIIAKNRVLIAPGGYHLVLGNNKKVDTNTDLPVHGVRPAVDVFIESAVKVYKDKIVGVILTGMGFDGARGMNSIKKAGGRTIAQNEDTCVVYGMPRAVVEMGLADKIAPLNQISGLIKELL